MNIDAASMCDTGALSRPTDATSAADAKADSLESGCGESRTANRANRERRTADATTNDRTTSVVTVQVEIEVVLIVYI